VIAFGERLELARGGPLGVDRQAPSVGKDQAKLDDATVDLEVGHHHRWRQVGERVAENVLPRTAGSLAAGEDRGHAMKDGPALVLADPALLFAGPKLLERPAERGDLGAHM